MTALSSQRKKMVGTGILFMLPALAFIAFAIFIPTIWNVVLSFQEWDGFRHNISPRGGAVTMVSSIALGLCWNEGQVMPAGP